MSDLKEFLEDMADLPLDILLGRIVVFTIYDHPIMLSELTQWFDELDLNKGLLPMANKRHDAFKKATKELDNKTYAMSGNRTATIMCRDVSSTNDYIERSMVREIRDSGRRRLNHTQAMSCVFYRENENVRIKVRDDLLEPGEPEVLRDFARDLERRFRYHGDFLDNMKIRAMVRGYLKKLNCVEIKPGVYYVPVSRDEELHRLAELVNRLGGGCHMNMIPIVNIKRDREFISTMFEREAAESLQALAKDARALITDRKKVSPAAFTKMQERYDEIVTNATEHMETLGIFQTVTEANEAVASKALDELRMAMLGGD